MTKEQFQELLQRYRAGNCSLDEIQKVNQWFDEISDDNLELRADDKARTHDRMLSAIRHSLPSGSKEKSIRPHNFLILKVAAGLLILMIAVYLLIDRSFPASSTDLAQALYPDGLIELRNETPDILKIALPDSSTVELNPNAEISYSKNWRDKKREVHLVGEAFFEVVKDSKRPFYVYGGNIVTKVLGTSFSVRASENAESIEVAVRTGKVSVYEDSGQDNAAQYGVDASGVVLSPNEKVEYFVNDKHWVTSLVEEPKPLPASNKQVEFVFSNTGVPEIMERIERTYSIDIVTENDLSDSCTFTGDVSMMELYDLLDVICKSTGTNYEVKGTKILITGRGCE